MPYKEAASWVCLTMFGAALYFLFDWWGEPRMLAAIAVAVVALAGLGYLVYQHHHPEAKLLPSRGIWVWLPLVLTWFFVAYAIHTSRAAIIPVTPTAWKKGFNHLELVQGKTFGPDDKVILDGKNINLCRFTGSTFMYDGTAPFLFSDNVIDGNGGPIKIKVLAGPSEGGAALVLGMLQSMCKDNERSCNLRFLQLEELNK